MDQLTNVPLNSLQNLVKSVGTAVVVIDMQNDYCSPQGGAAKSGVDISMMREIVPRIASFLTAIRRHRIPIVFIQTIHAPDGGTLSPSVLRGLRLISSGAPHGISGTWGAELLPELNRQPDEPTITKQRSGSFTNTDLDSLLKILAIRTIMIVGEQTSGCVESTVRQAADLDYLPLLITDCIGGLNDRSLHDAAMKVMLTRYDAATAEEVVQILDGRAPTRDARIADI